MNRGCTLENADVADTLTTSGDWKTMEAQIGVE